MKILIINFLIFFTIINSKTIWVSEVVKFSSEYSNKEYSANNLIGPPSVFFEFGSTPTAWKPKEPMSMTNEYLLLKFDEEIIPKQIDIYEQLNPGSISEIIFYNSDYSKFDTIFKAKKISYLGEKGRKMTVLLDKVLDYYVKFVKINLVTSRIPGYNEISAVALSDTTNDFELKINQIDGVFNESKVENLGANINTYTPELAPVINSKGDIIYFTRNYHPENMGIEKEQDIWFSAKDEFGNFSPAKNIGQPLNNEYSNFAFSISPDNNTLLVGNIYNLNQPPSSGISESEFDGKVWSFPKPLQINDFQKTGNYTSYYLASDGQTLLMSFSSEESLGLTDIFVSFLNSDGTWSKPKNLGPEINTVSYESTPFLAADGKTIYFSSDGYAGFGSMDIYYSKRLDTSWQKWSEPINLGDKINSQGLDAYFTIPASADYAYFVSTINSYGYEDIFRILLPKSLRPESVVLVNGRVIDTKTRQPLAATIYYENLSNSEQLGKAKSNSSDGTFQIILPKGYVYGFRAEAKNYIAINENIDLTILDDFKEVSKDLSLVPIEEGQTIRLNNIFFTFASFELLSDSYSELKRVYELMIEYPNLKIEIWGHTDDVGTDERNNLLSEKRANSVLNYLISLGIDKSRIASKGFGKTKPVRVGTDEESRSLNRRVEFVIISK